MKKLTPSLLFSIAIMAFGSCNKSLVIEAPGPEPMEESRFFHMGFTAFPYDLTTTALKETYQSVGEQGDIYLNHLDHGVPWDEAIHDLPFPEEVQQTLQEAVDAVGKEQKFFLSATATSQERNSLANYWNNEGTHQQLPVKWQNKKFNDPVVMEAYLKYCKRIIDFSKPDYYAYGIEINASFKQNTTAFQEYLEFADTIYQELKRTYPHLPIMLTFQDQSFESNHRQLLEITKLLLPYSDYIAMSTYPFWQYDHPKRDADPKFLADDWLSAFKNLDTSKPFAISETGFCAEDLIMDAYGVKIRGSSNWQNQYLMKLFKHANELETEFIIWFVFRDYDTLYDNYYAPDPITKIWKDSGIIDGDGKERPAYQTWQTWMKMKKT